MIPRGAGVHEALTPIATDLWVARRPLKLVVGDIGARMTVVRLQDGSLFVHSPVRLDEGTRRALDALGPVGCIVAPNKVHHLFVADYLTAYPQAAAYAAPGLPEKRRDLHFHGVLDDRALPQWQSDLDQHLFRGAPAVSEVVFFHGATRTLILTDLAFNAPATATGARVFHWLVGARGRFGPHRFMRLLIRDRNAARQSLARVLQWDFDRIIVSHGDVLETGGREKLSAAFAFL